MSQELSLDVLSRDVGAVRGIAREDWWNAYLMGIPVLGFYIQGVTVNYDGVALIALIHGETGMSLTLHADGSYEVSVRNG